MVMAQRGLLCEPSNKTPSFLMIIIYANNNTEIYNMYHSFTMAKFTEIWHIEKFHLGRMT